ncbi:MAG TPA: hypothetical protein VMK32_11945 [Burkholderiaceae bacterium]|nr:hypothetical protein [Burkholderiaceae bacterium]
MAIIAAGLSCRYEMKMVGRSLRRFFAACAPGRALTERRTVFAVRAVFAACVVFAVRARFVVRVSFDAFAALTAFAVLAVLARLAAPPLPVLAVGAREVLAFEPRLFVASCVAILASLPAIPARILLSGDAQRKRKILQGGGAMPVLQGQ